MKGNWRRRFLIFYCVMLTVGVLLLGVQSIHNNLLIYENTQALKNDNSAVKVTDIDESDVVYLEDGREVQPEDIESYAVVRKGEGTWYIEDYKYLAVESRGSENLRSLVSFILFTACFGVWLYLCHLWGFWAKGSGVFRIYIVGFCLWCLLNYGVLFEELLR